jgi:hypothetical protein
MNAVVMQNSSDLERKILQQQQELHQLAQSLQAFSGISSGVGSGYTTESSGIDVGTFTAGSGSTSGLNSLTNQLFFPAYPNFLDESLLSGNSNGNDNIQQAGCCSRSEPDVAEGFYPPTQALLQQNFSFSLRGESQTKDDVVKQPSPTKKLRLSETTQSSFPLVGVNPSLVASTSQVYPHVQYVGPGEQGQDFYGENDVLSGRGGGTNVHLGNRYFRDLINSNRRTYLKARKNDKPAISRGIVQAIRAGGGKFLKKCETTGLWFEIGDDAAREKTSQALRQRAPEMRKLLFKTKGQEEAVQVQQQQLQEQGEQPHPLTPLNQRHPTLDSLVSLMSPQEAAAASSVAAVVPPTTPSINFWDTQGTQGTNPSQPDSVDRNADPSAPLFDTGNTTNWFHSSEDVRNYCTDRMNR